MKTVSLKLKSGEVIKECAVFKGMQGQYNEEMIRLVLGRPNNSFEILDHRTEKFRNLNTNDIESWQF